MSIIEPQKSKLIVYLADSKIKIRTREYNMATSLTNLSELSQVNTRENVQVLSFTEEISKYNKIKYNLSIVYFIGLAILLTTLLW